MAKQLTWEEVINGTVVDGEPLGNGLPIDDPDVQIMVLRWFGRGDGIAVYENHDLGHSLLGHRQFVSYGSKDAQLETDEPPERLPDIGGAINWRYTLVGVYRPEKSLTYMWDIGAYIYQADLYCAGCIVGELVDSHTSATITLGTETILDRIAKQRGIAREAEETFDSDDFPKVVLVSQLEGEEHCGRCGAEL